MIHRVVPRFRSSFRTSEVNLAFLQQNRQRRSLIPPFDTTIDIMNHFGTMQGVQQPLRVPLWGVSRDVPLPRQRGHPVRASAPSGEERRVPGVPSPEEDKEVMHASFMHAYENSLASLCRIEGMQSFAGGMLARAQIPSQQYVDPLSHIFDEFDTDGNKVLAASEVGKALRSRDVDITDEQVKMFVKAVFGESASGVRREDFKELIMHMAMADFECSQMCGDVFSGEEGKAEGVVQSVAPQPKVCTFESDEDLQHDLEAWREGLLHGGGAFGETAAGRVVSSVSGSDGESSSSSSESCDEELDAFGGVVDADGTVTYRF